MSTTKILGDSGEEVAVQYALSNGYDIVERNRRFGREEIDIIAFDREEKMIVFIEVKTRSKHHPAYPIRSSMTPRKRAALRRAITRWFEEQEKDCVARIDLIVVVHNRVIEHLKDLGSEFFV